MPARIFSKALILNASLFSLNQTLAEITGNEQAAMSRSPEDTAIDRIKAVHDCLVQKIRTGIP